MLPMMKGRASGSHKDAGRFHKGNVKVLAMTRRAPTPRFPAEALDFGRWILWQDEWLLAVDKPAGVLSQGGEGAAGKNVVDLARAHLGRAGVGVLHRIDRNVPGVVLIAKEPGMASAMTKLFAKGQVERIYRAIVRGSPPDALVMTAWLAKDRIANEVRARPEKEL